MASGKFNPQAHAVLDQFFGNTAPTVPATWYLALFTVAPNKSGGGTEVSGGSYARVAISNNTSEWTRSAERASNLNEAVFPQATLDWGTVVAGALVDTASGAFSQGYFGNLSQSIIIRNGQTRYFPVGAIVIIEA